MMTATETRKPMKVGLDYVRNAQWEPKLFTRKGASRLMTKLAERSPLASVPGCVGLVSDCGDYWRGNVAAYPDRGSA